MVEVTFNSEEHKYFLDGVEAVSVTSFISTFFPTFDTKTMSKRVAKKRRKQGELNSKGKPVTAWDVRKEWNEKSEIAIARGNLVHHEIENWLIGNIEECVYEVLHPATKHGLEWCNNNLNGYELLTEEIVYNKEYLLAGTIDLMYKLPNGVISLADWKTNIGSLRDRYGYIKHPVLKEFKIPNSKLSKYYLQLNLYKRLLEMSGEKVDKLTIVKLGDDSYQCFEVPDMSEAVSAMLKYREDMLRDEQTLKQ